MRLGFLMTNPSPTPSRPVAWWLFLCCSLLLIIVVLGGITRLTQSGLSMVEWKPFAVFPPLGEAEWQAAFLHYQQFPEYKIRTIGMTLDDFKSIFWLEYLHRLAGRIIGVVFLVPFLWFLVRQKIDHRLGWKLAGLFLLGGVQGIVGWLMVKSGLTERPDVSQYRLTAHLGLALLIYGLLLWTALGVLQPRRLIPMTSLVLHLWSVLGLLVLTLLSGGFVAGLDAGFSYNTFPLMNSQLVPEDLWIMEPWYTNPFENVVMVQFQHRLLAMTTLGAVLLLCRWGSLLPTPARAAMMLFTAMAGIQVMLGILTLLLVVPIPLAVTHQVGAFVLFTMGLVTVHLLAVQPPSSL
ncbi:Heme A synthase, cytochrome oxidase biogenesis protein Cox15-CtaA [invertebrate metagenome]|uniref:Heme A synthase, cytochrome oxidase biogenesis protein Cox15-CtaA n=1 Tax=invertebrate metagenome TaxID=1711999 RepID=A0A484HBH7_9ZZZZ